MFISKFKQWLDDNDPYGLQRITFHKALFVATIATYVYWIFRPVGTQTFFPAFFALSFYESPALVTFAEKERLLIFMAVALIGISVSFYLVYPFKGTFFFFSVLVLAITYFMVLKYFYALKNLTMLLLVNGAVILSTQPQGSLQVAYNFTSAIVLAMATAFISLKIFPNRYLFVWNKAMQKFIFCLEEGIDYAIQQKRASIADELIHIGMVRNFRRLVPHKYLMSTYRFSINLRRIEHCLDSLYYETMNETFWHFVKENLESIRLKMNDYTPCGSPNMPIQPETKLQHYIMNCLQQVFLQWNKLCYLQQR